MLDNDVREQLKHIDGSKLVIAPAGSGKTTESVKYFMNALLDCQYPESALSVTFTNKATAEFRDRVLGYLRLAKKGTVPSSPHEMDMYTIAKRVLKKDEQLGWNLLANPNRLEIKTIDALCANIVSMSPIMSDMGSTGRVSERPKDLYLTAAKKVLNQYDKKDELGGEIRNLLAKFNNNFEIASQTLTEMLSYRDQWLPLVYEHSESERRAKLELHNTKLMLLLGKPGFSILASFESDIFALLESVSNFKRPEGFTFSNITEINPQLIEILKAIKGLIFTNELKLRKSFSKSQGFLSPSSLKDPEEKAAALDLKERAKTLVEALKGTKLEEEAKLSLSICDPHYTEGEWQLLSSILSILPVLTAQLLLTFKSKGECDFIEMQTAALRALGDELAPGKALLRLDNRLRHILVDEFQDCSPFQLLLLKRLTSGWGNNDGRTLYLVGDPMQSIYLFRNANVGLFINAAENGLGHIPLSVHQLTSNYRSQEGLISWINERFARAFGEVQDANIGATTYNASEACKTRLDEDAVSMTLFSGHRWENSQAEHIVNQIDQITRNEPKATIAVLGRTRADLAGVIEAMKNREVSHRAIDIHKLETLSCITDLTVLTRAICHLADKQAWVGLLRSPFVGLSLAELETVCTDAGEQRARTSDVLLYKLTNEKVKRSLTEDSANRLKVLVSVMNNSRKHLGRKGLDSIVKGAFYALGGLSLLKNQTELKAIDTFFCELAKMTINNFSVNRLTDHVASLYAPVEQSTGQVSVLTKHKAKGLEFDYVFVPHAHKPIRAATSSLMDFETIMQGDDVLAILSPDTKSTLEQTRMNQFIRALKSRKAHNEAIRLAYVASTRAKKRMYISGKSGEQYPKTSMLGILGVAPGEHTEIECIANHDVTQSVEPMRACLASPNTKLLPEGDLLAAYRGIMNTENDLLPTMDWLKDGNRIIGIIVHKTIENIINAGWDNYFSKELQMNRALWRIQLLQEGLSESQLVYAIKEIESQIEKLKASDFMAWAIQQQSIEAEKPIYVKTMGKLKKYILDITFIANGTRYLIDTKSGRPEADESEQEFCNRMLASYAEKMKSYKHCFLDEGDIYIGLYLSSIGKIATYQFDIQKAA